MTFLSRTTAQRLGLACFVSLGLAACGGGGGGGGNPAVAPGSTTPPVTITPQNAALWFGSTSTGRSLNIVVLDGGRSFILYSAIGNPSTTGGAIVGSATQSGASLAIDAVDFSWEGLSSARARVAGSLDSSVGYNGITTYDSDASRNFSFTTSYRQPSAQVIGMSDVAGAYAGTDHATVLTIGADGTIRGIAFSPDCAFTGTIVPSKNYTTLMHMALTFQGGSCAFGTNTLEGIAIYDPSLATMQGIALVNTGASIALFQAHKS